MYISPMCYVLCSQKPEHRCLYSKINRTWYSVQTSLIMNKSRAFGVNVWEKLGDTCHKFWRLVSHDICVPSTRWKVGAVLPWCNFYCETSLTHMIETAYRKPVSCCVNPFPHYLFLRPFLRIQEAVRDMACAARVLKASSACTDTSNLVQVLCPPCSKW